MGAANKNRIDREEFALIFCIARGTPVSVHGLFIPPVPNQTIWVRLVDPLFRVIDA